MQVRDDRFGRVLLFVIVIGLLPQVAPSLFVLALGVGPYDRVSVHLIAATSALIGGLFGCLWHSERMAR